jgi:tetratricopeptide (TPR) repeat protein
MQAYDSADYNTAIKKWEQGLKIARQAKHQHNIGIFISNLGNVHSKLSNYSKALDYFQQSLVIRKKLGDI